MQKRFSRKFTQVDFPNFDKSLAENSNNISADLLWYFDKNSICSLQSS